MVTKGLTHLHKPAIERCRFKFVWHFGTTRHERANKIHVYGYPTLSALQETIKIK